MRKLIRFIFSTLVCSLMLFSCANCLSETLMLNGICFSTKFPTEEMLHSAQEAFCSAKIVTELPGGENIKVTDASFSDGKIMVYCSEPTHNKIPYKKYRLLFDTDGTFLTGFYIEHNISNGAHNVIYKNGKLYEYFGFFHCLYEINQNAEVTYYYAPYEYGNELFYYTENIEGYHLEIETGETSNKAILTDEAGNQSVLYSDSYDSSWVKKQDRAVGILIAFIIVVNLIVVIIHIKNEFQNPRTHNGNQ